MVRTVLPVDLADRLRLDAERGGRSLSGQVRFLIRRSCEKEGRRRAEA
jgi:plasmid stability protein